MDGARAHLARGFAILFAVGAVSGTILSISLPLFWPRMMGRWGSLFGFPFMLEAFCFFLEAIFLGIYLYGWDRLSPWAHWWAGIAISASGLLASVFVMAANGWMQTPVGFTVTSTGALANVSPWRAIANPSLPYEATHMVLAAYMVMGLSLAAIYARRLRRATPKITCDLLDSANTNRSRYETKPASLDGHRSKGSRQEEKCWPRKPWANMREISTNAFC